MTHGSLFSGIGGFDLAAQWMGWENVFHCEWNPFGQRVLKHYWPNADSHHDITKTNFEQYANRIDILTGGFPCQPYSAVGKRKGKEDERHLWPEMLRTIREVVPRYVVGENVLGLTNWNGGIVFDEVHSDLELAGYEVAAVVIPAAAVNAPHGRDRVWFVARRNATDADGEFQQWRYGQRKNGKNKQKNRIESFNEPTKWETFPTKPAVCSGNDGVPYQLDGITFSKWRHESLKAYGNAIVPQVALQIFKVIQRIENGETL